MNRKAVRTLAVAVVALFVILYFVETNDREDTGADHLFPELKSHINEVAEITIERSGEDAPINIRRADDSWRVPGRDNHAASVAKIREVLLALADARIVEYKTSSPERYGQLGVQGPGEDGAESTLLTIASQAHEYSLIIGKSAPGGFRYVRIPKQAESLLIDKDPDLPQTAGDWLLQDLFDVKAADVRSVTVEHAAGETIRISKEDRASSDFVVDNVPEGRELSYATVANGMAGALSSLTLDDVRKEADAGELIATTTFETYDGLRIRAEAVEAGEETWFRFSASEVPVVAPEPVPDDAGPEADAGDAEPETADADPDADTGDAEPAESAESINARLAGWQYRLPDYKKNLLLRRWDDILKTE